MYSLQTWITSCEPQSTVSVPTSQFSRTATSADRRGPRPSSRPPSVSLIAPIIASPPSPSAAIIASPRRMQAETAPTAPCSRRNSTGNGPREASSVPPVAAEAWWRMSETTPTGPRATISTWPWWSSTPPTAACTTVMSVRPASPMPPIATVGWPRPLALQSITARCGSSALTSHVPAMNAPGWAVIVPTIAPCPSQASQASSSARRPSRGHTSCRSAPGAPTPVMTMTWSSPSSSSSPTSTGLPTWKTARAASSPRSRPPPPAPNTRPPMVAARASSKVSSRMPPVA